MATFSGTTTFPDTIQVDKIAIYTDSGTLTLPSNVSATTIAATTITGVNVPTVQTLTGAGTVTLTNGGCLVVNASGTNAIVFPAPTTVGALFTIHNLQAATGTNSITVSAGTFYDRQTGSGTVIKMALARQSVMFQVVAANTYQVISNDGTATFA